MSERNVVAKTWTRLCHGTEDGVVATNAGTVLFVCCFGVADLIKFRLKTIKNQIIVSVVLGLENVVLQNKASL